MKNGGIGSLSFKCIEENGILFIHAPVLMFNLHFWLKIVFYLLIQIFEEESTKMVWC